MKKLLGIIILSFLWFDISYALPDCKGEDFTKWKNCIGKFTAEDSNGSENSYHGDFGDKPGLREGFGKFISKSKEFQYIGELKNYYPDGLGIWKLKDVTYIGEQKFDKGKHGWGIVIQANGNIIAGQWKNDKLNGYANIIGANDYLVLLQGYYKDNFLVKDSKDKEPQCKGKYISPIESKNWTNCRGYASIDAAGIVYDADWINGAPTGIVSFLTFEGALSKSTGYGTGIYVGELEIDKSNGWGERDGMGINITAYSEDQTEGVISIGQYKGGFFNGKGITVWPNGDIYIGQFNKNLRHGKGIYMFKDGSWYNGNWKNAKKNGFGTVRYKDGTSYSGQFKNGKFVK